MDAKYVVIIQCDIAHNRCSGFACTQSFYDNSGAFNGYPEGMPYISFTCGGCCGKSVAAKLEHFSGKLLKKTELKKEDVAIHLSSCMVTDNHHYNRCPHVDYIKEIIAKKGFTQVVEGTYISKASSHKREKGIYRSYPEFDKGL